MAAAKKVLSNVNVKSYTSAFEPLMPMPSDCEIEKIKGMMEELKHKVDDVYKKAFRKIVRVYYS